MKNKMQTVAVKGGEFTMGSDLIGPIRGVKLDSFKIGKYPVTNAQYNEIMGKHKAKFPGTDLPAAGITFYDAAEFCNRLSEIEGLNKCYKIKKVKNEEVRSGFSIAGIKCDFEQNGYRLPTEAEWEYAAKGGKEQWENPYSGSMKLDETGWYIGNSDFTTHPVGKKKPNSIGIFDMSGNVFEWCWDIFQYYKHEKKMLESPKGPSRKGFRVIRGGSFMHGSEYALVAARKSVPEIASNTYIGFRVVKRG
jgi:formylglycine-generating enzyme